MIFFLRFGKCFTSKFLHADKILTASLNRSNRSTKVKFHHPQSSNFIIHMKRFFERRSQSLSLFVTRLEIFADMLPLIIYIHFFLNNRYLSRSVLMDHEVQLLYSEMPCLFMTLTVMALHTFLYLLFVNTMTSLKWSGLD